MLSNREQWFRERRDILTHFQLDGPSFAIAGLGSSSPHINESSIPEFNGNLSQTATNAQRIQNSIASEAVTNAGFPSNGANGNVPIRPTNLQINQACYIPPPRRPETLDYGLGNARRRPPVDNLHFQTGRSESDAACWRNDIRDINRLYHDHVPSEMRTSGGGGSMNPPQSCTHSTAFNGRSAANHYVSNSSYQIPDRGTTNSFNNGPSVSYSHPRPNGGNNDATVGGHHLRSVSIPTYNGHTDSKTPLDFLMEVERYQRISGYNEATMLNKVIPMALTGDAFA